MRLQIITLNFLQIVQSYLQPPTTVINPQIQCLFDLHLSSFEFNYLVLHFPSTKTKADELISLTSKTNPILKVVNFNGNEGEFTMIPQKFSTHIALVSTLEEFKYFLKKMYGTAAWSAGSKYLVGYFGKESPNDILAMFHSSWNRYVINIDIILQSLETFTYFPYNPDSKCGTDIQPVSLGPCTTITNPFPNKIPRNMNGCPIRAFVNLYPPFVINPKVLNESALQAGFDLTMLNAFIRRYNMTRTTIGEAGAFAHFSNGKYGGSLRYIMENISDISLGSLFPNVSYFIDMDVSIFYHHVHFSWVVPAAKLGAQWKSLILIFNELLWIIILVVIVCNIFIWFIFGRFTPDNNYFREFSICMLKCWYSFLQGGINLPFSFTMRILVIFWVFFALLLATLYQSQLLSILLTPVYEHQIQSSQELVDSKVNIYFKADFMMRLNFSGRPTDKDIVQKGIIVSTAEHAMVSSKFHDNGAFLGNRPATLYLMPRNYSYPSGKPAMYMCKNEEFGNPIAMFFRKGYPLLHHYNKFLQYMISAGYTSKWLRDATYFSPGGDDSEPQKFTVEQLSGAFFVLCFGLTGALLIFILECVTYKCHKKCCKNSKKNSIDKRQGKGKVIVRKDRKRMSNIKTIPY